MKTKHFLVFLFFSVLTSYLQAAELGANSGTPTPSRALLALSKKDHTLAIVDPSSLKVVARVPVGPDPHEVIASSDGKLAFVTNMGNGGDSYHELDVIDLVNQKALPKVDTGPLLGLHGIAFAGGKVWFTAQEAKAVGRYDPVSSKIDWIMGTGQDRTHMIYVSEDQKHIYTTNVESGTVSIFDLLLLPPMKSIDGKSISGGGKQRWEWKQTVIETVKGDEGFDISPDKKELWTTSPRDGSISVVNLENKKLTSTFDAKANGANRLKFTPDGKQVLVTSLRTGDVIFYDSKTRKEMKRINIGKGAAGILMDPAVSRAFIGCTADDYIAVIDLKEMKSIDHIEVGGMPDGLAWSTRN